MSANYWVSTHRNHWIFPKDELATMRQKLERENSDLVQMFTLPEARHLYIYFNQQISRLSKRLKIRQQAIATAQVYIKRFFTRVEIRRTNPYLVIATAVYLACKIEECPQHIRLIVSEARSLWQDFISLDTSKLGECEFFLISEMSSQLIVHQPYRTLTSLQTDLRISNEDFALAWSIINDHYMTDLPLLYSPHTVALTAILLALVLRPNPPSSGGQVPGASIAQNRSLASGRHPQPSDKEKPMEAKVGRVQRFVVWLADSDVDIAAMVDCTQEIISFYNAQEQYNDKLTREQISRFVKARGLDK
ncbi:unnamed protein product [Parascedosporium putredinis]|uniref:RNA polymerase II holoenzyme cyclin-like subunit n=1 Tax=Parascedosporium putredinis TaxID=1442378 RepID=A0A9P1HA03_9PEZI|nr:unnamed protein product [Parascedosporium putredinis]CAI8004121.1 unnamed protein product [Parascedosporium putredinis]